MLIYKNSRFLCLVPGESKAMVETQPTIGNAIDVIGSDAGMEGALLQRGLKLKGNMIVSVKEQYLPPIRRDGRYHRREVAKKK